MTEWPGIQAGAHLLPTASSLLIVSVCCAVSFTRQPTRSAQMTAN